MESPAKAVSVQKYLGDGHVVLASYGHVRDLVEKSGSVVPERGFEMVWEERARDGVCLLYTSPSPRDRQKSRMPSSA